MAYEPDREKYIQILQAQGLHQALSQLHHEIWEIEEECFEGAQGYRPDLYEDLKKYRAFSTELWNLNNEPVNEYPKNSADFDQRSYGVWGFSDRPHK